MKKIVIIVSAILLTAFTYSSCNNGPKVIEAESNKNLPNKEYSSIFKENGNVFSEDINSNSQSGNFTDGLHQVTAKEILNTEKYVYIKVSENNNDFWIATAKQPIDIGKVYYYRNSLLKTNFESKEFNKVFDTIYLVSQIVLHNHGNGNAKAQFLNKEEEDNDSQKVSIPTHTEEIIEHKGSIKIADLIKDPKSYEGKTIQITGKCVKVNPNIMNRNWIHLQDGTSNSYDLVATSNTFVPEGQIVTIKAKVSLNRDFGAGYRYDLILENAEIIK